MSKSSLVTNGKIRSTVTNKKYSEGWDRIFGNKSKNVDEPSKTNTKK